MRLLIINRGSMSVCYDKDVQIGVSYKVLAYVTEGGNIQWQAQQIEPAVRKKIEGYAEKQREKFRKRFERYSDTEQYVKIMEALPAEKVREFAGGVYKDTPLMWRLEHMRAYYYSIC